MISNVYREEILEHYREPQNFGKLSSFDVSSKQLNTFCGDEIEMFIKFKNKGKSLGVLAKSPPRWTVEKIGFLGKGCAISIASASILTEFVKGKKKTVLTKFSEEDMLSLLQIEVSETRKKCALLGWAVLQDCL
ncbi:MAG: iron-sulfur cluster assembly scaffold protein [Candidatus Levybacteria bacterium]|nr:iron-sulfur cluster assembly scaffold protein [Candidatus Levybacteria bacterium]